MDNKERQERVKRSKNAEIQKIELSVKDTGSVSIDTKILNKLTRKCSRIRK